MFSNDGYALLIGINDYSVFDQSTGQAKGTSDLMGSCNDVRSFWRLCRLLGMKPGHLRVLSSPPIDFHELEGASSENVLPATEAEIKNGVAWLSSHLGHGSRPTGLLTYSGHGDWLADEGLVLCPSDVADGGSAGADVSLQHAVSFRSINEVLAKHDAAENLTVVLDTCHSGGSSPVKRSARSRKTGHPLSLTARPISDIAQVVLARTARPVVEALSGRVLAAAGRDQVAYQSMFDGHFRGVFSWAICSTLEQWKPTQEGHNVRVDLSYDKLLETSQRLITALWFNQTPELHGPIGIGALAVLHQGLHGHPGETKELPDGGFKTEELDSGVRDYLKYTITNSVGTVLGVVIATNTAGGGIYDANYEYWYMYSNVSMSAAVTITSGPSQYWSTPPTDLGTLSFRTNRIPSWTSSTPRGTLLLETNAFTGQRIGMKWAMSESGGVWTGTITWWNSLTGNLFGPSQTNTVSPGTPASGTWYFYTNSPV
jgi:hypothetical protein